MAQTAITSRPPPTGEASFLETSNSHLEFYAEDTPVTVIPNFREEEVMHFMHGEVGPFRPQQPIEVPLWLAVALKKMKRCQIQVPDWLTPAQLEQKKEQEKTTPASELSDMPHHYVEVASLLFNAAPDDIPQVDLVRTLLEDVEQLRQSKINKGVKAVGEGQAQLFEEEGRLHQVIPVLLH